MSITSQIIRIQTNIANAYDAAEAKGATLPAVENTENLASTIESITTGGGSSSGEEITAYNYTATELKQGDWVYYNTQKDNTSFKSNYAIGYDGTLVAVAPSIIAFLKYSNNNEDVKFYKLLGEEDTMYTLDTGCFAKNSFSTINGIDKDGFVYTTGTVCGFNYSKGIYHQTKDAAEHYVNPDIIRTLSSSKYSFKKVNKFTTDNTVTATYTGNIYEYPNYCKGAGYLIGNDLILCFGSQSSPKVAIWTLKDETSTYTMTGTDISCTSILGKFAPNLLLGVNNDSGDLYRQGTLLALQYSNGTVTSYAKENFPATMQACFDNACYPFWNEQYGIFTAYIPTTSAYVVCQYKGGAWVDYSSRINISGVTPEPNIGVNFFVSPDLSYAYVKTFESNSSRQIKQYGIASNNDGTLIVPYDFADSNTKMGKIKNNVAADIGENGTIIIPSVTAADPSTPDTPTIDPSELKFGDRIDNKATVVGTYNSNDLGTVVYAVLDAQYRGANIAWSTGLYVSDIDTGLPNYGSSAPLREQNHESATYNTNFIINNYSDKKIEAFTFVRNVEPLTYNGKTYKCQLPNAYELLQIFNKKTELDALDPTAEANSTKKLSNWGFGSNSEYVLTSNECSKWRSWEMGPSGSYNDYNKGNDNRGVCPIIEIPINTGVEIDVSNSEYTYSDGNLVLTKYTGTSQDVTIPNPFYKG